MKMILHGVTFTSQEWKAASLLASGLPAREVAVRLGLTYYTLKVYIHRMYVKMRCVNPEAIQGKDCFVVLIRWVVLYEHEQQLKDKNVITQ